MYIEKVWQEAFEVFEDTINIELRDINITTSQDLAFSHQLVRVQAMRKNGTEADYYWERSTFCFRKIDCKWLLTHEHVSLPTDFETGKAVLDLKP